MTSLELIEKREKLRAQAQQVLDTAQKEQRKLTDDEQRHYNALCKGMADINAEIDKMQRDINARQAGEQRKAEKPFSLLRAINDIANNRQLDDTAAAVVERGMAQMRKSGQSYSGQLVLPTEARDLDNVITAGNAGDGTSHNGGKENVATDVLGILEPLRANMAVTRAGATLMTGLIGNVQIPTYSGSNVGWAGEVAAAASGAGNWGEVSLSPKRLTAYVDVSKQFLIQDSNSAEEMLRRDIINAISEKLEQTILGAAAGSATQPAGLLNGVAADNAAITYADIVAMEAALEAKNVYGDLAFIVSPTAKATLKTTAMGGTKSDFQMIMTDGEIDGLQVHSTSAMSGKGVVLGAWREYVIAQWGAIDLTVDPYTQASNGMVRLVVNAYFDAKPRRAEAFKARVLKAD